MENRENWRMMIVVKIKISRYIVQLILWSLVLVLEGFFQNNQSKPMSLTNCQDEFFSLTEAKLLPRTEHFFCL
jgi:hypothetical protein